MSSPETVLTPARLRSGLELTPAQLLDLLAVAIAAIGAALVSEHAAGLDGWWALVGLLSALPLYVVARGWRLPWWLHVGAAALPASVIVVALFSHGGWLGAARATRYGWGALLFLAVAAWATTAARRTILACIVAGLIVVEYGAAWWPWWGGGNPAKLMWGTFYWHNQFGAYSVAGVAVSVFLVMFGRRWFVIAIGGLGSVFGALGAVESGSRTAFALLTIVGLIALVVALSTRRLVVVLRFVGLLVVTWAMSVLASSAVFFSSRSAAPTAALLGRTIGNDWVQGSGVSRLDFWWVALQIGAAHPFLGGGLSTYGLWSACFGRTSYSSNPHDELMLGWAEGGIVGVLPLLAVLAGVVALVIVSLRRMHRPAAIAADPARWGALLALVLLVAHAGMDFDWSYPSLVAMVGLVGGIATAPVLARQGAPGVEATAAGRRALALALVAAILVLGVVGIAADAHRESPLTPGHITPSALAGEVAECS